MMDSQSGGLDVEGAQQQRQADLYRVVEPARVEAGERGDLVEPVAEGIAVDGEPLHGQRWAAVGREKGVEGLEQLGLMVERAEQVGRKLDLRPLVGDADEGRDPQ